jgi:hypothetical protein
MAAQFVDLAGRMEDVFRDGMSDEPLSRFECWRWIVPVCVVVSHWLQA